MVITSNDLRAPVWPVVAVGVIGIVVGRRAVERAQAREAAAP